MPRLREAALPMRWRLFNLASWQQAFDVSCA
jgi:hypothetical protein